MIFLFYRHAVFTRLHIVKEGNVFINLCIIVYMYVRMYVCIMRASQACDCKRYGCGFDFLSEVSYLIHI